MTRRTDVRATYDRIASHFAATRPEPWPEVASFLEGRHGGLGLDLGCGNGRHAELLSALSERTIAADLSRAALETARERAKERGYTVDLLQLDSADLPISDNVVDLAVYVAALHHLPSRPLRVASLDELARALAPGGAAIVSAWSVSHERFDTERGFDTTVDWTLPYGEVVPRFYHVYDLGEFEGDLEASALDVREVYEAAGNCYAHVSPAEAKTP